MPLVSIIVPCHLSSRAQAALRSTGRFLVFLDADDHLLPHALEAGLAEEPACGFTVGGREEMTFDGARLPHTAAPPLEGRQPIYVPLLGFEWFIMPPSIASALADDRPAVRRAFDNGLAQLTEVFRDCLLENVKDRLCSGDAAGAQRASALLAAESPHRWARLAGRWSTVD